MGGRCATEPVQCGPALGFQPAVPLGREAFVASPWTLSEIEDTRKWFPGSSGAATRAHALKEKLQYDNGI